MKKIEIDMKKTFNIYEPQLTPIIFVKYFWEILIGKEFPSEKLNKIN